MKPLVVNKKGFYRVPLDEALCARLRGTSGISWSVVDNQLVVSHADVPRNVLPLIDLEAARIELGRLNRLDPSARELREVSFAERNITLRNLQHSAIDFIKNRHGTLLADDMRCGKTLSCVGSHDPKLGPLVVVAPLSTRGVWLSWMMKVFPGVPIGVCTGKTFDPKVIEQPLVFGHYEIIQQWQSLRKIGTLVLDEAHWLSNPKAKRSLAAFMMQAHAERVIAATGTPIWNRPAGMWSILHILEPAKWGRYHEFASRYGDPQATGYGVEYEGISNEDELRERLSEIMIRRRWVDVAADIPPITRTVAVAEVSDAERKKLDILAAALQEERSNTAANLAAYRRQVTGIKVSVAVSEAKKTLDNNEPVVVWTWHKDFAIKIAERLGTPYVIHGDIAPAERERRMQAWKDSLVPCALVATMAVAQVGIDLSHARFAIFAEIDFTPAVLAQAEMRTFAPTRAMYILFIVANHLVDQRIVRALVSKLSSSDPLGVAAAQDSIDALREAVMGKEDHGDLDRLLEDLLASST